MVWRLCAKWVKLAKRIRFLGLVFDNGWQEPLIHQIHTEDVFGPLLGRVAMSWSKVMVTRDKKHAASLQITSRKQQAHRLDHWRGVSSLACIVRAVGLAGYCGALPRIFSSTLMSVCLMTCAMLRLLLSIG